MRRTTAVLLFSPALLACVLPASTADAQFLSPRVAVSAAGEWRPSVQAGAELRGEIGDGSSTIDSMGVTHRRPPAYLWSAMLLGGATFARDGRTDASPRATAQAQLGVMRRTSGSPRAGAYAVAIAEPATWGALARYEPLSAAGVQLGWLHRTARPSDAVLVQLDVALAVITDLVRGGGSK